MLRFVYVKSRFDRNLIVLILLLLFIVYYTDIVQNHWVDDSSGDKSEALAAVYLFIYIILFI